MRASHFLLHIKSDLRVTDSTRIVFNEHYIKAEMKDTSVFHIMLTANKIEKQTKTAIKAYKRYSLLEAERNVRFTFIWIADFMQVQQHRKFTRSQWQ